MNKQIIHYGLVAQHKPPLEGSYEIKPICGASKSSHTLNDWSKVTCPECLKRLDPKRSKP